MLYIGIAGKRGSGKGELFKLLNELFGGNIIEISFADKLKESASVLTGLPLETFITQDGKKTFIPWLNMTAGELLQKMGDGLRETVDKGIWIKSRHNGLDEQKIYCNTSVRYRNEADEIKSMGGVLIRVEGNPVGMQGDGTRDDNAPSETELDNYQNFDVTVSNIGTLEELRSLTIGVHDFITKNNF